MKYTEYESLEQFLEDIKPKLNAKSPLEHSHNVVNGLSIVVSETNPTVNDESVITLVVSTDEPVIEEYDYVITGFEYTYFGTTGSGRGRLVFYVTVDKLPDDELDVAARDLTQVNADPCAGTVYTDDSESETCNLWYEGALTSGEHVIEIYLLDGSGNQVSAVYTATLTAT